MLSNLVLRYKNISFHRKLLLSYVALLLIPLMLLSWFTYNRSRQVIRDQAMQMASQSTRRAADDVNAMASSAHRLAMILNQNTRVREIVEKDPLQTPRTEQVADFRYLENLIESLRADSAAHSIRLYVPEGFLFAGQGITTDNLRTLSETEWFERIVHAGNAVSFDRVQAHSYLAQPPVRILPAAFPLYSMQRYQQVIGVIRIDYLESTLLDILQTADFTGNGSTFLLDASGDVVTASGAQDQAPFLMPEASGDGWQTVRQEGQDAIVRSIALSIPGWRMVTAIPLESLLLEASSLQGQILLFALGMGVLILLLAMWTAGYNSRRILALADSMQRAQQGDLDTQIVVDSEDEIGILQHSFNFMIRKTEQMMDEKYQLGQSLKGMELIALQNQINPHFLYNTLDLIHWSAREGDSGLIASVVEELSKYYRLSLSQGKTFITLADEISHVIHYVNIQNFRFRGRITLQLRVEEDIMQSMCLKLILQPIVENAILHGILEKEGKQGDIRILGEADGDDIVLKVVDDGIGMTDAQIAEITSGEIGAGKGYGVWNINQRLQLHYGDAYRLEYSSCPDLGTICTIRIPRRMGAEAQY